MSESDRLASVRKVLVGVAEGVRNSTLMKCRFLANQVMRHRDTVLKDCSYGPSFVNELRVRPVNTPHLFDSVIGAMKAGYQVSIKAGGYSETKA